MTQSDPTAADLIAETRRLCASASPEPWLDSRYHEDGAGPHIETSAEQTVAVCSMDVGEHSENGVFIARSRSLLPALADRLERALADASALRVQRDNVQATNATLAADLRGAAEHVLVLSQARAVVAERAEQEREAHRRTKAVLVRLVAAHDAEDGPAIMAASEAAKALLDPKGQPPCDR